MFLKLLGINKKGDLISLFVLLFIFSLVYPQLGINNLLHLNTANISYEFDNSYTKFFNETDILLITKNDSSKIYTTDSIIESNYKIKNGFIKSQLINSYSLFKINEDLLSFKMQNHYTCINSRISFHYNKNFNPTLFFQIDNNKYLSYGIGNKFIRDNLKISILYKLFKYYYHLQFIYDEFVFSNSFLRNQEIYESNIEYNQPKINLLFKLRYNNNYINKPISDDISQRLGNDYYTKYSLENISKINIAEDKKIILIGSYSYNQQAISLIYNDVKIININKLENQNKKIQVSYSFKKRNSDYNIGLLFKNIFFESTGRIRTSIISNSLEATLGAPIVNNYDIGTIVTSSMFFNYHKIINNNLKYTFNTMFLREYYDITVKNDLINIFVDPEVTIEKFKYKRKDGLELGIQLNYNIKKTNFIFSFNQHIPLKIIYNQNLYNNEYDLNTNIKYGGGKFQILIIQNI